MANLCVECEHNYVHNRNGEHDYICSPCRDKEEGRLYPKVVDILGNELELGDHVVWPTVVGRSAEIAHGTILEIRYSTGTDSRWYPIKVKIQPAADSRWHGRWNKDKDELPKPVTLSKAENVVRVPMP